MRGHRGPVHSLTFSAESTVLVSGSADETVRLWDVSNSSFPSAAASANAMSAARAIAGSKDVTGSGEAGGAGVGKEVAKRLTEGQLLEGKAAATVGLLPQSTFMQDGIKDT